MIAFLIICVSGLSLYWLLKPQAAAMRMPETTQAERLERKESDFQETNQPVVIPK